MSNGQGVQEVEKKRNPVPAEIGGTGLRHYGGVIYEEQFKVLHGRQGVATYGEMRNDPVVGGMLLAIDNFVRRVEWEFDPPDEEKGKLPGGRAAGNKWADFMHTVVDDMAASWADTISEIFSKIPYGWSFHEVVLKQRNGPQEPYGAVPTSDYDDGLVGWAELPIRSQDSLIRWEFGDNDRAIGMHQQLIAGTRYVPFARGMLFRTSSAKNNPEGRSVLRAAHRPWYFKRRLEEYEATGIERDLAGLPIGKIPSEYLDQRATPELKAVAAHCLDIVTKVRRNEQEGLLWPSDVHEDTKVPKFALELLSSGGSRSLSITDAINRKNTEIALTVLADWLLMGHQSVGTQALGGSKIDLFVAALETWTKAVADVFNAHGIPQLMRLNGVDPRLAPRIRPTKVTQVDATTFVQNVAMAINATMLQWSDADEDHVRANILDLPPREEGPPVPEQPQVDPNGPPAGPADPNAAADQMPPGQQNPSAAATVPPAATAPA